MLLGGGGCDACHVKEKVTGNLCKNEAAFCFYPCKGKLPVDKLQRCVAEYYCGNAINPEKYITVLSVNH